MPWKSTVPFLSMEPFLDIKLARLRMLAHAAPNPLMACIWETAESYAHGFRSHLQNGTPMDSAGMEDLLSFLGECICMSYVCHMTDISFLTELVTGKNRCGTLARKSWASTFREAVLAPNSTSFQYYEGVLGMAGVSGVMAPRALALS